MRDGEFYNSVGSECKGCKGDASTKIRADVPCRIESFEITASRVKTLDVLVYDRSLVGKHDVIATGQISLDPTRRAGSYIALLPLSPRGMIKVVIASDGGERNEPTYYLDSAAAYVGRTEEKMADVCVERVMEIVRDQLCARTSGDMVRPVKAQKGQVQGQVRSLTEADVQASLGDVFAVFNANVSRGVVD